LPVERIDMNLYFLLSNNLASVNKKRVPLTTPMWYSTIDFPYPFWYSQTFPLVLPHKKMINRLNDNSRMIESDDA
jgi:hypothetical protein